MSYRPLARGIRAAVMNVTGGVQRHPTHFDFFARAPLDTRSAGPQAAGRCADGNDAIVVEGDYNYLFVCPASALPAALDLVFFRRARRATTC